MNETISSIKKILNGEHYFFKKVWRIIVKYKGVHYVFDKKEITSLSGEKSVPIEFLSSSTEVCICSLELEEEGVNDED